MAVNARWRQNPFTGTVNSILITEEEHTIEFHPEVNAYGFYADEGIELDPGVPVILVEDNTAQTAFTEIPKTIAPNAGQYRVDYDAEGYFNTGFVNCNSGDVGKNILFTYYGTGTIVHPTFRLQTQFNLAGDLNVEGDINGDSDLIITGGSTLTGNVVMSGDALISGNTTTEGAVTHNGQVNFENDTTAENAFIVNGPSQFNVFPDLPDGSGSEPGDYQAARYIDVKSGHGVFFTTSTPSSFTVPDGVTQLLVELAGGGGGGGGGYYTTGGSESCISGGGGGSSLIIEMLDVTPGDVLNITLGTGGAGGAASSGGGAGSGANGSAGSNSTILIDAVTVLTAIGGNFGFGAIGPGVATANNGSCSGTPGMYQSIAGAPWDIAYGGTGGGAHGGGSAGNSTGGAGKLGCGGSGGAAAANPSNVSFAGGAGGAGYCKIIF